MLAGVQHPHYGGDSSGVTVHYVLMGMVRISAGFGATRRCVWTLGDAENLLRRMSPNL
jgi:hypothetical protein